VGIDESGVTSLLSDETRDRARVVEYCGLIGLLKEPSQLRKRALPPIPNLLLRNVMPALFDSQTYALDVDSGDSSMTNISLIQI
jgi:hypothetical protein